jgi:Two component regulator propeller
VRVFLAVSILFFHHITAAQQPIGSWREYLPYGSATQVVQAGSKIITATPYSFFLLDPSSNTIERFSRITGLSETGVSRIHYDNVNDKLVVAYDNSTVDIIYRNDITAIRDITRDNIAGDKTIYDIYSLGHDYYLSTGLGIIVVNGDRNEIKDTWFIGTSGAHIKVSGMAADNAFLYAATTEGLKKAAVNSTNLADYSNWQLLDASNGLYPGNYNDVISMQGKMILQKDDSLFVQNGNTWGILYHDDWEINSLDSAGNKILLCESRPNAAGRVVVLNTDGTIDRIISQAPLLSQPHSAVLVQNEAWIADGAAGLLHIGTTTEQYQPNSPRAIATGEIASGFNRFYATAGEVDASWAPQNNPNGIYRMEQGEWTNINGNSFAGLDSLRDFISIAIDPTDETAWAGSFGGGLLHTGNDQHIEVFKQGYLSSTIANPLQYRVAGLSFDKQDNLWISNYGASLPLSVRKKDGGWKQLAVPFSIPENALTQIITGDNNYKWIVAAKGGGVLCFDDNFTPDNTVDDHWRLFSTGSGNGNLPAGEATCLAIDKNGFVWAGTTNGIAVCQCTQDVFTAVGCEAIWPVVKQGNFAGYLFNGQEIRSIVVDGADRKWVATKNGVFLISASGEEIVLQFTKDNSPLLDDDVRKIAIDGGSGEVFFATAKGLCSFRSTATEGNESSSHVLVFPNPVPPSYSGTIGIRGLVSNAIVKITEMDGRLVYQTRAAGGQAVWDGRDYKGRRISTGVYLVVVSDDEHSGKTVAKIIFIGR